MKKYLGIDVGTKKTGIAVSDDGGTVAFPVATHLTETVEDAILAYCKERAISEVVVGESYNLKGEKNKVMIVIHKIVSSLEKQGLVVHYEPEYYSTKQTKRLGRGTDAEAAAVILQSFLDRHRRGG